MTKRLRVTAGLLALAVLAGAAATALAQKDKDKGSKDGGTVFEVYQDSKKEWRWRYKAANGKIIATPGDAYGSKSDAKRSVEAMQERADKYKVEFYEDKQGEHRWRLKATNGNVVAVSSQGYKNKPDAEKGLTLLTKGAKTAKVVEVAAAKDKEK